MTPTELAAHLDGPAGQTPFGAAVLDLLRRHDRLREHARRLADQSARYEQMRVDLDVARAHLRTYEAELDRVRKTTAAGWEG